MIRALRSRLPGRPAPAQQRGGPASPRDLVEHAPVGIFETDAEGRCLWVNARYSELTGLAPERALGTGWLEAVHPDDAEVMLATWQAAVAGSRPFECEARVDRPDGRVAWVAAHAAPRRDAAGAVVGYVGTLTDVGARRAVEASLAEARETIERMAEAIDETYYSYELLPGGGWRFLFTTRGTVAALGLDPGLAGDIDALADAWDRAVHPDDRRLYQVTLERLRRGEDVDLVYRLIGADGRIRYVRWRDRPRGPVDGRFVVDGVTVDITAEVEAERALAEARDRLAGVLGAATEAAIMAIDLEGQITIFNVGAERLLGYREDEVVGTYGLLLFHLEEEIAERAAELGVRPGLAVLTAAVLEHGAETRDWTLVRKDGSHVAASLTVTAQRGADGEPTGFIGIATDVTERRAHLERLAWLADHDPLTGACNRRRFQAELDAHLARCERYGPRGAVLAIDLDRFKAVNDALGHARGDALLVSIAGAMRERLRESDVLARIGGDEFAVLLPEGGEEGACAVAASLCEIIAARGRASDGHRSVSVTASIGVAPIRAGSRSDAMGLLVEADLAMYGAKGAGDGNSFSVHAA